MDIEPPSNPSTGKVTLSPSERVASLDRTRAAFPLSHEDTGPNGRVTINLEVLLADEPSE